MANLDDISSASRDSDLRERFYSAAAEIGIPDPEAWVLNNARQLAASPIADGDQENSIASVYAFARSNRTLPAGADPAAVTDNYIRHAVQHIKDAGQA